MNKPNGKAVSVSISETRDNYGSQHIAITMEDGSVWMRGRSKGDDWEWTEWECLYTPDPA